MKIFVQSKNPGSFNQIIDPVLWELDEKPEKVADLIKFIVAKVVKEYNRKVKLTTENPTTLIKPYADIEIQNLANTGRIIFDIIYNEKPVNLDTAIETALQGYEDGLFKIFINNELVGDSDSEISMADGDLLTIVRLTFLSGRIV